MAKKVDEIVAFADIGEFIHQSVKLYSSGMFARLAFAVATSVKPDILIIVEALSVGDGAFARKSFERIMELNDTGCTIVFCSHTHYQVEMICSKALWLSDGMINSYGTTAETIKAYEHFMLSKNPSRIPQNEYPVSSIPENSARLDDFAISVNDIRMPKGEIPIVQSCQESLSIRASWISDFSIPPPSFAVTIHAADGRMVGSAGSHIDGIIFPRDPNGKSEGEICFPDLPLLKGEYEIELYLLCEKGVMFYDQRIPAARICVVQPSTNVEQGLVHLPRKWRKIQE
jgi:lipopolysaccharide transport system ATP-binding protein